MEKDILKVILREILIDMKLIQDLEIIKNIIKLANGLELVKEDLGMTKILKNQNMMIVKVIKKIQRNLKKLKEAPAGNKLNQVNIAIKRMIATQRNLKELKKAPAESK